jgi:hypothetical protein
MKRIFAVTSFGVLLFVLFAAGLSAQAQQASAANANNIVPPLVNFSGVLTDLNGKPMTGVVGVTFLLYKDSAGGAPLWLETQNVRPDKNGHYTAMLGSASSHGLPAEIFMAGEAHWLGVQVQGQEEQARVLLVSAPYALKAGDAETLGGFPASAFVLAAPPYGAAAAGSTTASPSPNAPPPAPLDVTTGGGTVGYVPLWDGTSDITNSAIFQTGSGSTARVGVNITTPSTTLDVKGISTFRGALNLPGTGAATATAGKDSQPLTLAAAAFNSSSKASANQTFEWQAEPVGNDTATPSGTLNLLFGEGTAKPAETGLNIAGTGVITFATGQTFPGVPDLSGANTFSGNQSVTGNVTASGEVQGGIVNATTSFDLGGSSFASGSAANSNAFLGFAGNASITGGSNTAVGYHALLSDTTGGVNVAMGVNALSGNTTGAYNVAAGANALGGSTSGFANTGLGNGAGKVVDGSALTGKNNVALGTGAAFSTGTLNNASAIGANAVVGASNTMVLGSINGINGQTATVNVGIGISTPSATLQVLAGGDTPGGIFSGYSLPPGAGLLGTDGLDAYGGNSDLTSNKGYGGTGIEGKGGLGVIVVAGYGADGPGGIFQGADSGATGTDGDGIRAYAGSGYAGYFSGSVFATGSITPSASEVKLDHPLDPANKYLVHASVESSEMKNIYDGNITTDADGHATVQLPEWFEALNRDFRYQLTVIGQFAQAIIAHKIENNQFEIRTSAPNVEVSWQVTGVRQDAYARANPLVVEQEKAAPTRGYYIHPELFGAPAEKQLEWALHPYAMKHLQASRPGQQPATAAARVVSAQPKVQAKP